jgi:hypothetical protein
MPLQIFGGSGLKIPVQAIFLSGATQMLAMAASNEALRYVSYPTQVTRMHRHASIMYRSVSLRSPWRRPDASGLLILVKIRVSGFARLSRDCRAKALTCRNREPRHNVPLSFNARLLTSRRNSPAQVLGKSCKMVPVMLFGILIGGKWKDYKLTDYLQVRRVAT